MGLDQSQQTGAGAGEVDASPTDAFGTPELAMGADALGAATGAARGPVPHQAEMEQSFGASFGDVQATTGAGELRAHGADAVAHGNQVAFADVTPSPSLVAHELTHVVQQRRAGSTTSAASGSVSDPSAPAEREAHAVAAAVAHGEPASSIVITAPPAATFHLAPSGDSEQEAEPPTTAKRKRGHAANAPHWPRLEASPETVQLEAEIGTMSPFATVIVKNPGDQPVTIKRVVQKIMPADDGIRPFGDYQVDGIAPGAIVPAHGLATPLVIQFHPQHQHDGDGLRTTKRPAHVDILGDDGEPAATIHVAGTARPPGGGEGKEAFASRIERYEAAIEKAADQDEDRDTALAKVYADWASYMSADELAKYEESHPAFAQHRARYQKYYGDTSNDPHDPLNLPSSGDPDDVPNLDQDADGNMYSYTERSAKAGAARELNGDSDPRRALVTAYALALVGAPLQTTVATAIVDGGEAASGYDVSGRKLSDEQRGAKAQATMLDLLFAMATGASEGPFESEPAGTTGPKRTRVTTPSEPGADTAATSETTAEPEGAPQLTAEERKGLVKTKSLRIRNDGAKLAAKLDDSPMAIGRRLETEAEGQAILDRLAAGDADALADLGVKNLPDGFNPATKEFALVETRDGYVIVAGGPKSVSIPDGTRVLGHTHPESVVGDNGDIVDLSLKDEKGQDAGVTFDEIAQDQKTSNAHQSGLIPSAADIDATGEGGRQVLHTRYTHAGGGRIVNPEAGAGGAQVNVVISDVHVLKSSPSQKMTIYEAQLTVQAGDESIWNGTVYARHYGIGGGSLDQVFFQPTPEIKRLLAAGGATP